MAPEVLHLVFAAIGIVLGWYLKHHSIGIPQEVLDAVKKLLGAQQASQGHALLRDLLAGLEQAEKAGAASPAASPVRADK